MSSDSAVAVFPCVEAEKAKKVMKFKSKNANLDRNIVKFLSDAARLKR